MHKTGTSFSSKSGAHVLTISKKAHINFLQPISHKNSEHRTVVGREKFKLNKKQKSNAHLNMVSEFWKQCVKFM